ncbi:MAG TPA: hypothetical protein VD963_03600 [Phycisphaerales bacterium]|nr:hypothetical protein [Phycisphaerales bacterium]
MRAALALAAGLGFASASAAQMLPRVGLPCAGADHGGRVVASFDFEEPENPEAVPRDWVRVHGRAGAEADGSVRFPGYNGAELDRSVGAGGSAMSARLPTRGGGTALRLLPGVVPVVPGAQYVITARVRTEGLETARALVAARFVDARLGPIETTETTSEPRVSGGAWGELRVTLPVAPREAAFLEIDLQVLQARQLGGGGGRAGADDLAGAAWFDDLAVVLVPRVELVPEGSWGMTGATQRPGARFLVRDAGGGELRARLVARDLDGAEVARVDHQVGRGGTGAVWRPDLPGYGWYRVTMEVFSGPTLVAEAQTELAWVASSRRPSPSGGIGLGWVLPRGGQRSERVPAGAVVECLGGSWARLAPEALREEEAGTGARARGRAPGAAGWGGARVVLDVDAIPAELAARLGLAGGDVLGAAMRDPSGLADALRPIVERHAERARDWRLGRGVGGDVRAGAAAAAEVLGAVRPGGRVVVPVTLGEAASADLRFDGDVELGVPAASDAGEVAGAIGRVLAQGGRARTVTVVIPAPERGRAGAAAVARLAGGLWGLLEEGGTAGRVNLGIELSGEPGAGCPVSAAALALRGVHGMLAPRAVLGRIGANSALGPVRGLVLGAADPASAGPGTGGAPAGALLLWSEDGMDGEEAWAWCPSAGELRCVDVFGNVRRVEESAEGPEGGGRGGSQRVRVGPTPVLIEGVDTGAALLAVGARLDPGVVPAESTVHELELVLANRWPRRVAGTVRLTGPGEERGWRITPRAATPFAIEAGGTTRVPVSVWFGAAEPSGPKEIGAVVRLEEDADVGPILLRLPLALGGTGLDLEARAAVIERDGRRDVEVTVRVGCAGTRERSVRVDVSAPGVATRQAGVVVAAGDRAVRRLVFPGAGERLAGKQVRVCAADRESAERVSVLVDVAE